MNPNSRQQNPQFIRFDRGISQFNHDYYAALGLPIIASAVYIRPVYLSIVRILHPDVYGLSTKDKQTATQYLAKLVNPAYNILMKEQERQSYQAIFKLLAKRLVQKSRNIEIYSQVACELMLSPNDGLYERSVSAIAKVQYQSLDKILEYTAQISELNLVYILYKEGYQYGAPNMPPVLVPKPQNKLLASSTAATPSSYNYPSNNNPTNNLNNNSNNSKVVLHSNDIKSINSRLKICEIYLSQRDWQTALKELREILLIDKENSKCLAMLGIVYKNINQPQMAKASFMRSLHINPQEPLALQHFRDLGATVANSGETTKINKSANTTKTSQKPLPPPQKRGWIANLLGWASPNDQGK